MRKFTSELLADFSKIVLFSSSYIPLIVIFILQLLQPIIEEINTNKNTEHRLWEIVLQNDFFIPILLLIVLIVTLFGLLSYIIRKTYDSNLSQKLEVNNLQNLNAYYITNYFSVYIFPFITLNLISFAGMGTLVILFVIIGYVYIKNDILYINPILNIFFKYNVYSVNIEEFNGKKEIILLSRKSRTELNINPNIVTQKIGYNIFIEE